MGEVSTFTSAMVGTAIGSGGPPLRLTGHPLQRCGARAITAMTRHRSAEEVTPSDLDEFASKLVGDIIRAAAAARDMVAYDWWKVLFALYPNSPATHSGRSRDAAELRKVISVLFGSDPPDGASWPCAFCGQRASAVWGKDKLPLFDTPKAVNMLPPRASGWPVCRGCRIASWALPYGAWVTAGSATVLTCTDDEVEHRFVARNITRADRILQLGFTGLPANASPETVTLGALRALASGSPVGTTMWLFKNDNQEAWLRVTATRGGVPEFLRRMLADPACRRGWGMLQAALTRRDKTGQVTESGVANAAKTLFDRADRPGELAPDRLPRELMRQARDIGQITASTVTAWQALCRLYLEMMYRMDTSQVKPARELITDWITQEPNPRGRFNQYVRSAGRAFDLQRLLMEASARLLLDGRHPPDVTSVAPALLAQDQNGWRLRGLLFFDVVADLVNRGAPVGHKTGEADKEIAVPSLDPDPLSGAESEDYA
jgi:CRISPR-associated protein Cst1